MVNAPGESSVSVVDTSRETPTDIASLQDKLGKVGLRDISRDVLERISRDTREYKAFSTDLDSLLTTFPPSPTELTYFRIKYIQGYSLVFELKDGRKLSAGEIRAMPEEVKDKILDDVFSTEELKIYNDWLLQVEQSKIKTNIDTNDKDLLSINERLSQSVSETQNITKQLPEYSIENIRSESLKSPPKELAGKSLEEMSSGKYDNILIADYYIGHAREIGKKIDPKDQERFSRSVEEMSGIIGRRPVGWPEIMEAKGGLVLGSARDQIRVAGDKAISEGYNKSVVWDSQSRSLIFRGDKGEKIIDTAYIPPRERISVNGLSISRDIIPVSPETIQRGKTQDELDTITSLVNKDINGVRLANLSNIPKDFKKVDILKTHKELQDSFLKAKTPEEKLSTIDLIRKNNHLIEEVRRNSMTPENMDDPLFAQMEDSLYTEIDTLNHLEISLGQYINTDKRLKDLGPIEATPHDRFDDIARKNLYFLTYIGYDRLGQDGLDRVISALNSSQNPRKKEMQEIRLTESLDEAQTKALTLAIANLVRNGRLEEDKGGNQTPQEKDKKIAIESSQQQWDNVDQNDPIIASRQLGSFGFKEALAPVSRNMRSADGRLNSESGLQRALFKTGGTPNAIGDFNSTSHLTT